MTKDIATTNQQSGTLAAGGKIKPIVPQTMEDAYRLAKAVCIAGMAPKNMASPEKCMIAIMHGLEIGLTPMAALQRIAIVNGRPTLYGDGVIGLVQASGLCEDISERIDGEGDARVAVCEAKRRGQPTPIVRSFSVADAKKAGLWSKSGPWQEYPERMLRMRARAFALRDGFADVLGGLYLKEEIDDIAVSASSEPEHAAEPVAAIAPPTPAPEHVAPAPTPAPEQEWTPSTSAVMVVEAFRMATTLADLTDCGKANAAIIGLEDERNQKWVRQQFRALKADLEKAEAAIDDFDAPAQFDDAAE